MGVVTPHDPSCPQAIVFDPADHVVLPFTSLRMMLPITRCCDVVMPTSRGVCVCCATLYQPLEVCTCVCTGATLYQPPCVYVCALVPPSKVL